MDKRELTDLDGTAAVAAVLNGKVSAEDLTATYLAQIEAKNAHIGAVRCRMDEAALATARDIDSRRRAGDTLGPLAGLPVLVKENCDIAGVNCSAGLAFRKDRIAPADSDIVKRLRAADAVILGLSVSDPGAFSTRTADVTHPDDPALTVGGSSGGSGAALAADMCIGAIGTDTGGSIRIPAACCGMVGLKPSYGALSLDGIFPLVPSLDHVGPMARTLDDLALFWQGLTNKAGASDPSLAKRIGFDPAWIDECEPPARNALMDTLSRLQAEGVDCVGLALPPLDKVLEMHSQIFTMEAWRWHAEHHAADLDRYPDIARKWFAIAETLPLEPYERARTRRAEFTSAIDQVFDGVGAILTPTMPCDVPAKTAKTIDIDGEPVDYTMAMVRNTCLFDHTGHPALAFPLAAHQPSGVPVSVQLICPKGRESALLDFAMRHFCS